MVITVDDRLRRMLLALGVNYEPETIDVPEEALQQMEKEVKRQHPTMDEESAKVRALARMISLSQNNSRSRMHVSQGQTPGPQGPQGWPGRDGKDGKDGKGGRDGRDGEHGNDGKDGKPGENGKDGNDGRDGRDGKDGEVKTDWRSVAIAIILTGLVVLLITGRGHAQQPQNVGIVVPGGTSRTLPLPVDCVSGCSGGGGGSDVNLIKIGGTTQTAADVVDAINQAFRVNITNGSIAVTGPLTDTELRASDLSVFVSNFPATQPISGTVAVSNFPATYAVTQSTSPWVISGAVTGSGTFTVAGTVTANAGTDLNTSLLALESGGNLATIAGKDFATQTTLALIKAKTDNIDVALSTRTKPADAQHTISDSGTITTVSTVSNIAQIASTTPTFGDVNNSASIAGALNGAPVGRYDSTQPTLTSGRFNLHQLDSRGSMMIAKGAGGFSIDNSSFAATQATASSLNATVVGTGTFATQSAITAASGSFSSGALSSGSIASGAIASGAIASGAVASGAYASGSISDGADVTQGAKADARSTATDTTAITAMQVLKEISFMEQNPASRAVTNTGTFAVQAAATLAAETTKVIGTARIIGNGGATLDATVGAGTAPTNQMVVGALYNSTEISPTTGQAFALQADAKGRVRQVIMDAAGNTRGANVDANSNLGVVLAAETTKVLGVTRNADGAGNLLTSNSTTFSSKFGLDANLLGTLGTAFTTAGFVDIKGADGNVFVRNSTASNLKTAATLDAETTKVIGTVRLLGNAGGILDTTQNATVAANSFLAGCNFTTSPASVTSGNQGALQCNSKGELLSQLTDGTTNVAVIAGTTALKTDMSSVAGTATVTAAAGVQKVGIVGNANAAIDAATGAAPPANAVFVGGIVGGATGGFLGGIPVCDSVAVVNISTATTTLAITGVSGRHVRICGLNLITAAANNFGFLSGTGATCGTGTAGMTGGTTSGSNWNVAANGGIAFGSGIGTVMKTVAAGDSVCIITSASTQLSGSVSYVIY